jgi:hypothetical protein
MAICPQDGAELQALPKKGEGTYYVCTTCKQHWYGTGGLLTRSAYTTGGQATITAASTSTATVSHGIYIAPAVGEVQVSFAGVPNNNSGVAYAYVSAYSSLNFVITCGLAGAYTSGTTFSWTYTKQ